MPDPMKDLDLFQMYETAKGERDEARRLADELANALGQFKFGGGHYGLCVGLNDPRHKYCKLAESAMRKAGRA